MGAELTFELGTRGAADRLDHAPVRADQDPLLRGALDPDEGAHPRDALPGMLDLFDHNLEGMWNLIARAANGGLPDQLAEQHALGLVRGGALCEQEGPRRHLQREVLEKRLDTLAGAGGDREHLIAHPEREGLLEKLGHPCPRNAVDLVDGHDARARTRPGARQRARGEAIATSDALLGIEH